MLLTFSVASALLSLFAFANSQPFEDASGHPTSLSSPPPPQAGTPAPPPLKLYSPTDLAQLCKLASNYCIYVDQVRPGTVHASPVAATDARESALSFFAPCSPSFSDAFFLLVCTVSL